MAIYPSEQVGGIADAAVSVAELTDDQYNGALVDEAGNEAFSTDGSVAALSALSVAEIQAIDRSVTPAAFSAGAGYLRQVQAIYDITGGDDGAVGAHDTGVGLPANCIILGGIYDVTETFTDGADDSATIAISVEGANDIVTATAISAATDFDQGLHATIPVFTAAAAVKVTDAANIIVTVADDEIDSGSMVITLFYIPTEVDAV